MVRRQRRTSPGRATRLDSASSSGYHATKKAGETPPAFFVGRKLTTSFSWPFRPSLRPSSSLHPWDKSPCRVWNARPIPRWIGGPQPSHRKALGWSYAPLSQRNLSKDLLSNSGRAMTVESASHTPTIIALVRYITKGKEMSPAACCGFAHLASRPGAARVISRRSDVRSIARASSCRGSNRQS